MIAPSFELPLRDAKGARVVFILAGPGHPARAGVRIDPVACLPEKSYSTLGVIDLLGTAFKYLAGVVGSLWLALQDMGDAFGANAAKMAAFFRGDFDAIREINKLRDESFKRNEEAYTKMWARLRAEAPTKEERDNWDLQGKGRLSFDPEAAREAERRKREADAIAERRRREQQTADAQFEGEKRRLEEQILLWQERERLGRQLTESEKLLAEISAGKYAKLRPEEQAQLKRRADLWKVEQDLVNSERFMAEARAQEVQGLAASLEALTAKIEAARSENETYGLQASVIARVTALRLEERRAKLLVMEGTELQVRALDIEIAKYHELAETLRVGEVRQANDEAARKAADAWRSTADSVRDSLTDALMRGFESGKDFARNLRDTLKNMFQTLVLRPIIQPIAQMAANRVMGMLGMAGGVAGVPGSGGILGAAANFVPSLLPSFGAGVAAPGMGLVAGAESLAINASSMLGLGQGATGALIQGAGMLAQALPYIGIAVALYSMFAKPGGGPKSGGSFMGGWDASGLFGGNVRVPGSDNGRFFTPSGADSSVRSIVEATSKGFFETIRSLGGSTSGVQFGLGYDTDPKGTAPNRISSAVYVGGRRVFGSQDRDVGRDDATLQAELQLEAQRALLAALQASDLPDTVATIINSLDVQSASVDAINNAIALATAVKGFLESTKVISAGDLIQDSQRTAYEAFRAQGRALADMARSATLSTESIQNLTQATAAYRAAAASLILEFQNARANVGSAIEGAIFNYRLAGMDQQGQYNFLQAEADKILAGIGSLTDAQAITDAVRRAMELSNQAFGMLSPEERMQKSAEFIAGLEELRRQADTRLASLQQQITDSANEQLTTIKGIVTDLVNAQKDAASTTQQAANTLNQGAQTFSDAVGRGIDIRVPPGFSGAPGEVGS